MLQYVGSFAAMSTMGVAVYGLSETKNQLKISSDYRKCKNVNLKVKTFYFYSLVKTSVFT